jgi:4-aminobutyrate aminotransferase-like enzyme
VLILDAGRNVLRFLPPLVIKKEHIDKAIAVLDKVIGEEEK